jgi:anthranilate 1,2-dioxygenase (deaminating, decarboxylating) large subunit
MIKCEKYAIIWALLFFVADIFSYGLPQLGLGYTNILEGGPIRPNPGIYWQNWLQYYTTQRFLDDKGKPLGGVPSPHVREFEYVTNLAYQTERQTFLGGMLGFETVLPFTLVSKVDKDNALGIKSSGSGVGDLGLGVYVQWPATFYHGRPIFVHRLEFSFTIPLGKNELPEKQINPSHPFFRCGPTWSATLYFSHKWNMSWDLDYVWCAKNEKIDFRNGDAIFGNYSLAYEPRERLYIAAVGYFLQQLHNNKALGVTVPDSKERIFAIGPGVAYFHSQDVIIIGYLYLEAGSRNRTQGTSFISRLVLHF